MHQRPPVKRQARHANKPPGPTRILFGKFYAKRDALATKLVTTRDTYLTASSLVARTPTSVQPYLRLMRADKPIGTHLLFFPCAYSICLATPFGHLPSLYYLGLFGTGAFLMRGAGCIINDFWDKDLDKQVGRTRSRPIASGEISTNNAIKFLAVNLSLSLGILLSLNLNCIMLGVASMIPVVLYPLAKRYTVFPQAVLGMTFNIGAIMGYVAVTDAFNWAIVGPLYLSCFMWTIYYDTVYAMQDIKDDEKAGIKSIVQWIYNADNEKLQNLTISERMDVYASQTKRMQTFLWATASLHIVFLLVAAYQREIGGVFNLAAVMALGKMLNDVNDSDSNILPGDWWKMFTNNRTIGFILTAAIIVAIYQQPKKRRKTTQT